MIAKTVKNISQIVIRLFAADRKVLLGRWARDDGNRASIKIDRANTDHCGTCSLEKELK